MKLQTLNLVLENEAGELQHQECARVAVVWQGKELA